MNKRILVVDDEEDVLYIVGELLKRDGWDIYTERRCEPAFELSQSVEPFLCLCDLRLSNHVDGATLAGMIRRNNPYTVIICMTGELTSFDKGYLLGSVFTDILLKPIDTELLRRVTRYANDKYERWKSY